jgi:hypothetical protein
LVVGIGDAESCRGERQGHGRTAPFATVIGAMLHRVPMIVGPIALAT